MAPAKLNLTNSRNFWRAVKAKMGSQVKKMMVTTENVEQVLSSPVRFMYNLAEETCW